MHLADKKAQIYVSGDCFAAFTLPKFPFLRAERPYVLSTLTSRKSGDLATGTERGAPTLRGDAAIPNLAK